MREKAAMVSTENSGGTAKTYDEINEDLFNSNQSNNGDDHYDVIQDVNTIEAQS